MGARRLRALPLFGDLPFMVGADSADVWSRQDEFDLESSVGEPPDAFSERDHDWLRHLVPRWTPKTGN